jgi:glucosylceramidase
MLPMAAQGAASRPWQQAAAPGSVSVTESGAGGREWFALPSQAWVPGPPTSPQPNAISLDRGDLRQEVLGFGSCFTDTSAYNALVYAQPAIRDALVEAVWGATGLRSSVMRMHINSPDYSVHSYNFDNVSDDFSLASFDANLTYDQQRVIPLIRLAQAKAAGWGGHPLRLFGSPWSPPGWMKNNNNMINSAPVCLKNDTSQGSYRQAWATYIKLWLEAYEAQGISLWGLTPQNEPQAAQHNFESCVYDVPHYVDFVGKYLGPTVLARFPHLQILGFDHNKMDSLLYAEGIAEDGSASAAVAGMAVHWYDVSCAQSAWGGLACLSV